MSEIYDILIFDRPMRENLKYGTNPGSDGRPVGIFMSANFLTGNDITWVWTSKKNWSAFVYPVTM